MIHDTLPKSRITAKEAISERWASRAQTSSRRPQQSPSKAEVKVDSPSPLATASISDVNTSISLSASTTTSSIHTTSPICAVWKQVQSAIEKHVLQQLSHHQTLPRPQSHSNVPSVKSRSTPIKRASGTGAATPKSSRIVQRPTSPSSPTTSNHKISNTLNPPTYNKRKKGTNALHNKALLTESLTQIKLSSALQREIEAISDSDGQSSHYLKSVLNMLPKEYVDETSAWKSSIQDRKRAFVLLDLGRVIRAHALFLSYTCGFGHKVGGGSDSTSTYDALPPTHRLRRRAVGVNSIGKSGNRLYIQPQFRVTKNPNIPLLRLLVRLGVDLRCNSSDDVEAASQAIREERKERRGQVREDGIAHSGSNLSVDSEVLSERGGLRSMVDDASKTRKPDSYFRRLYMKQATMSDSLHGDDRVEVAVDDVYEVERISNTFKRFMLRSNRSDEAGDEGCRFMLRLPSVAQLDESEHFTKHLSGGAWEKLVLMTHAAAVQHGGELMGVSVDLSPWSQSIAEESTNDSDIKHLQERSQSILTNICTHLRLFRLIMLSVGQYDIRIDLTCLPYPLKRDQMQFLTSTLSNIVSCSVTMEELIQIHVNQQKDGLESMLQQIVKDANNASTCSLVYTADISNHLVANAGALCARIIGVKTSGKNQSPKGSIAEGCHDQEAIHLSPSNTEDSPQEGKSVQIHYYIDDGCYGSLGSSKCSKSTTCAAPSPSQHSPIPLYGNTELKRHNIQLPSTAHKAKQPIESRNVNATVWGPTCDGLDRVCEAASLPNDLVANRDWLVFPQLGCGGFGGGLGLGTAFNGFDPPDVAFCILNYFSPSLAVS